MKKITTLTLVTLTMLIAACSPKPLETTLKVSNNSGFDKVDSGIILSRESLTKQMDRALMPDRVFAIYNQQDSILPFQLDDLDGDGQWDELFFVVTIPKNSTKSFIIRETKTLDIPSFTPRTNVRFADIKPPFRELTTAKRLSSTDTKISQKYFQMEGPAWENEYVAFRNYFDARNGIDIYGKRLHEMILNKVGINGQNYHELADWGMDILHVGTSLGAGAIAMEVQDSVYRIDYSEGADVKIISKGPLRGLFELHFPKWQAAGRTYDITHRISIPAGKRYYQSEVNIVGIKGDEKLVSGLVNLHNDTLYTLPVGQVTALATHDKQAFDSEYLGMALMVKSKDFLGTGTAPDSGDGITSSHLIKLKISDGEPTIFRSYACWQFENEKFKDLDYFMQFLTQEGKDMGNSLKLEFVKNR